MSLLSIVVSVYNEEDNLERFLEVTSGVLRDSMPKNEWDYELIFVNDGSKDRTLEMLEEIAEKDKNDKYFIEYL